MKRSYVVTLLCAALAAPSALLAQKPATPAKATTRGEQHQMAPMEHEKSATKGGSMAATHAAIQATQTSVIRNAAAVEKGASAKKLNLVVLRRDARRVQSGLQTNLKRVESMEGTATDDQKQHITDFRTHENEALKHADALVAELKKTDPAGSAVEEHAKGVLEHARAADEVIKQHGKTQSKPGA